MIVLKKNKELDAKWEQITLEEAIDKLEGSGYWKKNTVKDMLEDGEELWSPYAFFKKQ